MNGGSGGGESWAIALVIGLALIGAGTVIATVLVGLNDWGLL